MLAPLGPDFVAFLGAVFGLLALVGLGEVLRRRFGFAPVMTRRMVHAGVALFVAATPFLFARPDWIYVLAVGFVMANGWAWRKGWLGGLHAARPESLGTVTMPLVLIPALFVAWSMDGERVFALQTAFLILALADPVASWVGETMRQPVPFRMGRHTKSVAGSVAFFGMAFVLSLLALIPLRGDVWTPGEVAAAAFLTAAAATAAEALGGRGWDNFFIVVAALVTLIAFDENPAARATMAGAALVGLGFGWLAFQLRFLDRSGATAGGLLAASLLGLGGAAWAVPAFTFFILSSLLSKMGKRRKASAEARSEKGDVRDAGQVYANGGVGWGLLLAAAVGSGAMAGPMIAGGVLYVGFIAAFAAAAADTWATEIGTLARGRPRLITTGRRVPKGTSGAVSGLGTLGAALGAAVVVASAVPFGRMAGAVALLAAACGFLASFLDSLAGATLQARYRDPATGETTERPHDGYQPLPLVRGYAWLNNDRVNLIATLFGAILAITCFLGAGFGS